MRIRSGRPSPAAIGSLIAFVILTILVVAGLTMPWDVSVLQHVGGWRSDRWTDAVILVTTLGDGAVEAPLALGIALLLWRMGRSDRARRLMACALTAEILYLVLKPLIHRPRPDVLPRLAEAGWYSYPSGHSMLAPIIWGFGCILLARTVTSDLLRVPLVLVGLTLPILIAASRVYLGVHYPSDVLGALVLGTGWALLWRESVGRRGAEGALPEA